MRQKDQKHNCGQALMITVVFLSFISLVVVWGISGSAVSSSILVSDLMSSKKSYFLAESGVEDVSYRVLNGETYSTEEVITLDGYFATTTVVDVAGDIELTSRADSRENIRNQS